ncbi:MAG: hypothetical protein AB2L20_15190 [Mangrovibacterium sp.]
MSRNETGGVQQRKTGLKLPAIENAAELKRIENPQREIREAKSVESASRKGDDNAGCN